MDETAAASERSSGGGGHIRNRHFFLVSFFLRFIRNWWIELETEEEEEEEDEEEEEEEDAQWKQPKCLSFLQRKCKAGNLRFLTAASYRINTTDVAKYPSLFLITNVQKIAKSNNSIIIYLSIKRCGGQLTTAPIWKVALCCWIFFRIFFFFN